MSNEDMDGEPNNSSEDDSAVESEVEETPPGSDEENIEDLVRKSVIGGRSRARLDFCVKHIEENLHLYDDETEVDLDAMSSSEEDEEEGDASELGAAETQIKSPFSVICKKAGNSFNSLKRLSHQLDLNPDELNPTVVITRLPEHILESHMIKARKRLISPQPSNIAIAPKRFCALLEESTCIARILTPPMKTEFKSILEYIAWLGPKGKSQRRHLPIFKDTFPPFDEKLTEDKKQAPNECMDGNGKKKRIEFPNTLS